MSEAYMNHLLVIDLSLKETRTVRIPDWLKTMYAGGKGFAARILYDLIEPGVDPLGPDNLLVFMTGPLTGTAAPCMRSLVACLSPLTGGYLDSYFGGHFGPEIKFAGYDGIIVRGRAEKPVYVWIRDDRVEILDAGAAWGLDAFKTSAWIKNQVNEPFARTAVIGPAGENQVRYALISCEYNRQAGRGGAGAVMGSKNLKAIAVRGSRLVRVHDAKRFLAAVNRAREQIDQSPACQALTHSGTSYAVPWSSAVGTLPNRNFNTQTDPKADRIGDQGQSDKLFLAKAACFACPIRCAQMGAVRTGKYAGLVTDTIEYESAAMLGSNLGIHDIRALAFLARECDRLGVDTISMGNVIGFAFEAAQKGLIPSPKDAPFDFGSIDGARHLIHGVCHNRDELGRLLSRGVRHAAENLKQGTEAYALHVKGMEIPGWAPRGTPGMGLAYMTADRGACHQRGFMIAYEAGGEPYEGKPVAPYGLSGKARILKNEQDYLAGTDAMVKCDFAGFGIESHSFVELYAAATGQSVEPDFLKLLGERIWNLIRLFNLREGFSRKDERLPARIADEPLEEGPHQGQRISPDDMDRLLDDYYQERGWNRQGEPEQGTLRRLGLLDDRRLDPEIFQA